MDDRAKHRMTRLERYNSSLGSESYLREYHKVHRKLSDRRERLILRRFAGRVRAAEGGLLGRVLDMPCGFGRLTDAFSQFGRPVHGADWSFEMLRLRRELFGAAAEPAATRAGPPCRVKIPQLPFRDRCFDAVFSIRLNHHLKSEEERREHLREILRLSARYAVFTFFDHDSPKNRLRRLRAKLRPKKPKRTLRRAAVHQIVVGAGFELLADISLFAFGSGHRYVLCRRISET